MAKPNIGDLRALPDFLQTTRWDLSFTGQIAGMPDIQGINIRCQSSTIPILEGTSLLVAVRGHKVKAPGQYDYDMKLELQLVETIDMFITNWFHQWKELCWETVTGKQHSKRDVTTEAILYRLDGMDNPLWKYTIYGCFLESYTPGGNLDGDSAKLTLPTLTMAYDYFEEEAM